MKAVSGKKFYKLVEAKGWELKRISGSHHIFAKAGENPRKSFDESLMLICASFLNIAAAYS